MEGDRFISAPGSKGALACVRAAPEDGSPVQSKSFAATFNQAKENSIAFAFGRSGRRAELRHGRRLHGQDADGPQRLD
jgi:hypothetical protein